MLAGSLALCISLSLRSLSFCLSHSDELLQLRAPWQAPATQNGTGAAAELLLSFTVFPCVFPGGARYDTKLLLC